MDVKLGAGRATGMFYHAPAGTALPSYPSETLDAAWTHIGDVSDAGITLALDKSSENLRNWANVIKRVILTDHSETIQAPIMDTTEESLKAVLGEDNVTVTAASGSHGKKVVANLSSGSLPDEEAFLWVMKDGDDLIAIGCTNGQVSAVDNVNFAPGAAINWTPTITAMGDNGFQLIMEEAVA
ncbi:MAG: hypothetical protein IJ860_07930 [Eubacterium sp.]|nr:hypothetical protein [Eubacterium sp.]